ncbi:hypothetical protein DRQ36_03825 [bacterium]|nr:MAG: hypothetical protein DRQ36_03825 [bacterium]
MGKTILLIFILLFGFGCAGSLRLPDGGPIFESDIPWGTTRGDCAQWALRGGDSGEPFILWRVKTKSPVLAPPVAGNGAVFVGMPNKRLFAFDARTGEKLGKLWVDVPVEDGISYRDGLLAITGRSIYNKLGVYDVTTGEFKWKKDSDRAAAAPIICDNTLYFSTSKGSVFALDAETGEKIWRVALSDAVIENEPAFRDSLVFIADLNGKLFCLTADSGIVRWELELPGMPVGPPIVIPDHIIIPTSAGRIPVITLDGSIRVEVESPGELIAPVACTGPTIYGVTRRGIVFAGDLGGGGIMWQTSLDEPVIVPPVVWGMELAAITASGRLVLLNSADGEIEHELELEAPISAGPIIYDSCLFIGTESGELIAVGKSNKPMERINER